MLKYLVFGCVHIGFSHYIDVRGNQKGKEDLFQVVLGLGPGFQKKLSFGYNVKYKKILFLCACLQHFHFPSLCSTKIGRGGLRGGSRI